MKKLLCVVLATTMMTAPTLVFAQTTTANGTGTGTAVSGSVSGSEANNANAFNPTNTNTLGTVSDSNSISGSESSAVNTVAPVNNGTSTVGNAIGNGNSASDSNSTSTANTSSVSGSYASTGGDGGSATSDAMGGNSTSALDNSGNSSAQGGNSEASAQQEANNAGNTQNITFNQEGAASKQTFKTVPSVAAAGLTTTLTETCMGSTTMGLSVVGWGATGGSTWRDGECVRRLNARELAQTIGDREAARAVLCGNEDVFRAYQALGRPCPMTPKGEANPYYQASLAPSYMPGVVTLSADGTVEGTATATAPSPPPVVQEEAAPPPVAESPRYPARGTMLPIPNP